MLKYLSNKYKRFRLNQTRDQVIINSLILPLAKLVFKYEYIFKAELLCELADYRLSIVHVNSFPNLKILTLSVGGQVIIWDSETKCMILSFQIPNLNYTNSFIISNSKFYLGSQHLLKYNINKRRLKTFKTVIQPYHYIQQGTQLVIATHDCLWIKNKKKLKLIQDGMVYITSLTKISNNSFAVRVYEGHIYIWKDQIQVARLDGFKNIYTTPHLFFENQYLIVNSLYLEIWNLQNLKLKLVKIKNNVSSFIVSQTKIIIAYKEYCLIEVYNLEGQLQASLNMGTSSESIDRLIILKNGHLAACLRNKYIKIWDLDTYKCLNKINDFNLKAILPNGNLVTTLKVWGNKN